MTKRKRVTKKAESIGFFKGTYGTYAKTNSEAVNRMDNLQKRTKPVNFSFPKRVKTIRITKRMPRLTPRMPKLR